jgi:sialidase-1
MSIIEKIGEHTIYENPLPQLRSRCAKFPGLVQLPSGELIALFELGEAFESVDSRTVVSRSSDSGKSWQLQGELYDMAELGLDHPVSECLKPTLLKDGTLIAMGYRFHRRDVNLPIGNPKTGGILSGDNTISFSMDEGKSWSVPKAIEHSYPETIETSGPCVQLSSGDIIATGAPLNMWDGSNPTGQEGILFRSRDKGKSWDCGGRFFTTDDNRMTSWESRVCEMQPGRLVAIVWVFDLKANKHLPNHIVVSHDYGYAWSEPIDVGHMGQASNLMWLGGEQLLSIHAHRAGEVGLYVRVVDFKNDRWKMVEEQVIWGKAGSQDTSKGIVEQFASLKFGQPSLLNLDNGEILATHWCVEDCQSKIKTHRLKLNL